MAIRETRLGEQIFPKVCPYTPEQTMNPDFLPEPDMVELGFTRQPS